MRPSRTSQNQPFKNKPKQDTPNSEELKKQLDTSSALNRTLGLAFMSVLIYMLITIALVTDMTLLLPDSKVNLPIINVEIGLFSFFLAAPILVLGLHFNLLINLSNHSAKLKNWLDRKANKEQAQKEVHPFIFNQLPFLRKGNIKDYLTFSLVKIGVFYMPLAVMLLMQLRFSDYQSSWMTILHFSFLTVDFLLIRNYYSEIILDKYPINFKKTFSFWNYSFLAVGVINLLIFGIVILNWFPEKTGAFMHKSQNWFAEQIKPRITIKGSIQADDNITEFTLYYMNKGFSESDSKEQATHFFGNSINIEHRNFNYAVLQSINLSHNDLRDVELFGADLRYSYLQKVNLQAVHLKAVNLAHTKLQGAVLNGAKLVGLNLQSAKLQGANLANANLAGANLKYAELHETFLFATKFQGAILSGAKLEGIYLNQSNFGGALMVHTYLKGIGGSILAVYYIPNSGYPTSLEYSDSRIKETFEETLEKYAFKSQILQNRAKKRSEAYPIIRSSLNSFIIVRKSLLDSINIPLNHLFIGGNDIVWSPDSTVNSEIALHNSILYQHLKTHVPHRLEEFRKDSANFIFSTTQLQMKNPSLSRGSSSPNNQKSNNTIPHP